MTSDGIGAPPAGPDGTPPHLAVGRVGERIAASFLRRRGFAVVATNVRVGRDEIDIVAVGPTGTVAVEVKTVVVGSGIDPADHFDAAKVRHLRRAMRRSRPPIGRLDLITVELTGRGASVRWLADVA